MSPRIKRSDRDLLSFRPELVYSEPDQIDGKIEVQETHVQIEDMDVAKQRTKNLAIAVSDLAVATQAAIDVKAKTAVMKLDPIVDAAVVSSVKRLFGIDDINPLEITYEQYRHCYDRIIEHGKQLGEQVLITPEDVDKAKEKMQPALNNEAPSSSKAIDISGFDSDEARNGGLRPELVKPAQIIEPLDIGSFQSDVIAILANGIWKDFIKPVIPLGGLPDEIAPVEDDSIARS